MAISVTFRCKVCGKGAEAFGKGNDAELLEPMVQQAEESFKALGEEDIYREAR